MTPRAQAGALAGHGVVRRARAGRSSIVDGFSSPVESSIISATSVDFSKQLSRPCIFFAIFDDITVIIVFDGSRRPDSSSRPSQTQGTADDHRNHPTGLQPGSSHSGATSTRHLISSGTTASLSQNSNPHFRQQRNFRIRSAYGLSRLAAPTRDCSDLVFATFPGTLSSWCVARQASAVSTALATEKVNYHYYWIHHLCSLTVLWYCSSVWP
jgi:hypothetical protein